jgi:4-amino-4-deoxy-L-arabinose transferase-like glycosyltransferase
MPTESAGNAQHPDVKDILFLVLIGFFLLAPWLSSNVVSLNAEERVWEVTKTMMRSKNFMVPYLNGEPHLTKPPMMYWLGAFAGFLLHREDPLIVRVPSMLCAIGAMCLTYLLGCRIKSRQIGFLAALVLVSSNLFTERSKLGTFDVALTAGVVLALYGAWLWTSSQKKSGVVLLFLGSWLGFMIKGPIAWLIIGIGVIGQLVMRKELKRLVSWRVLIFIVVLLVCSFLWFGYLIVHEPSARAVFVNELTLPFGHVGESSTAKHFKPFYQYLLDLPGDILPWTVYLPMIESLPCGFFLSGLGGMCSFFQ